MNTKLKKLKIKHYKNKLNSKYSYMNIKEIYYDDEDLTNTNFSKYAINNAEIKEFSIYDSINQKYINEECMYKNALIFFKNALNTFDNNDDIIFSITYNAENFRIRCNLFDFRSSFDKIDDLNQKIIVYDVNHTKLIGLLREEYAFEVLSYTKSDSYL